MTNGEETLDLVGRLHQAVERLYDEAAQLRRDLNAVTEERDDYKKQVKILLRNEELIMQLRLERDEYRAQVKALNKKLRREEKNESAPVVRDAPPRVHLPVLFSCGICPYGGVRDEELEPHEANVCGHPQGDAVSAGSPVINDDGRGRPTWCPMGADATAEVTQLRLDLDLAHTELEVATEEAIEAKERLLGYLAIHNTGAATIEEGTALVVGRLTGELHHARLAMGKLAAWYDGPEAAHLGEWRHSVAAFIRRTEECGIPKVSPADPAQVEILKLRGIIDGQNAAMAKMDDEIVEHLKAYAALYRQVSCIYNEERDPTDEEAAWVFTGQPQVTWDALKDRGIDAIVVWTSGDAPKPPPKEPLVRIADALEEIARLIETY